MLVDLGYGILTSGSSLPPRVPSILLSIGVDWVAPIREWTHPLVSPPLESFPFYSRISPSLDLDIVFGNVPSHYTYNTVLVDGPRKVLPLMGLGPGIDSGGPC